MKDNKGITLVALVITIIVLLILAGVTVASLSGEDGLLTRGSQAVHRSNVADAKEKVTLAFDNVMSGFYDAKYITNSLDSKDPLTWVHDQMKTLTEEGGQLENVATIGDIASDTTGQYFTITLDDIYQQDETQKDKTDGKEISVKVRPGNNAAKFDTWSDSGNKY